VAWIIAGIAKDVPTDDLFAFLGLLADDSGGVKLSLEHGLIRTNFSFQEDDPGEVERKAMAKLAGMMAEAGLPIDALSLRCVVSPPAPHVGWDWPAELRR